MNYKNINPTLAGVILGGAISLSSLIYLYNPLKVARGSMPTHYIAIDIDGNSKKDDGFALGYNNSQYIEVYVKVEDKFQKINDAKSLELKLAYNKLKEELKSAKNNHKQSLEKIKEDSASVGNILKETRAESN